MKAFEIIEQYAGDPRWEHRHLCPPIRLQDANLVRLEVVGVTKEGRYYRSYKDIDPLDVRPEVLEVEIHALFQHLNTFLDPNCTCVPNEDGSTGEPCPWHRGEKP